VSINYGNVKEFVGQSSKIKKGPDQTQVSYGHMLMSGGGNCRW